MKKIFNYIFSLHLVLILTSCQVIKIKNNFMNNDVYKSIFSESNININISKSRKTKSKVDSFNGNYTPTDNIVNVYCNNYIKQIPIEYYKINKVNYVKINKTYIEFKLHIYPTDFVFYDKFIYFFDGKTIYKFDENLNYILEQNIFENEPNYVFGIYLKDDKFYLFSLYNYDDENNSPAKIINPDDLSIISNIKLNLDKSYNLYGLESFCSYEEYFNPLLTDDFSYFMLKGMLFHLDSNTNTLETDSYLALSKPIYSNGNYIYKALKTDSSNKNLIYIENHKFNKENEQITKFDYTEDIGVRSKVYAFIGKNDIYLFQVLYTQISSYTSCFKTEVIYLNNMSHVLIPDSYYLGFVLENSTYTFEFSKTSSTNICDDQNIEIAYFSISA